MSLETEVLQGITSTSVQYHLIWHCKNRFEPSSKTFIAVRDVTDNRYLPRNSLPSYPDIVIYLISWQLLSENLIITIQYSMPSFKFKNYATNFIWFHILTQESESHLHKWLHCRLFVLSLEALGSSPWWHLARFRAIYYRIYCYYLWCHLKEEKKELVWPIYCYHNLIHFWSSDGIVEYITALTASFICFFCRCKWSNRI